MKPPLSRRQRAHEERGWPVLSGSPSLTESFPALDVDTIKRGVAFDPTGPRRHGVEVGDACDIDSESSANWIAPPAQREAAKKARAMSLSGHFGPNGPTQRGHRDHRPDGHDQRRLSHRRGWALRRRVRGLSGHWPCPRRLPGGVRNPSAPRRPPLLLAGRVGYTADGSKRPMSLEAGLADPPALFGRRPNSDRARRLRDAGDPPGRHALEEVQLLGSVGQEWPPSCASATRHPHQMAAGRRRQIAKFPTV